MLGLWFVPVWSQGASVCSWAKPNVMYALGLTLEPRYAAHEREVWRVVSRELRLAISVLRAADRSWRATAEFPKLRVLKRMATH